MTSFDIEVVTTHPMELGETPLWHPMEQALYWIDIAGQAVHRHVPSSGSFSVWPMPGEPGCIAWSAAGGLIVALRDGIHHLDTGSGKLDLLEASPFDTGLMRFNDGRCDSFGRLWVGALYEPRDRAAAPLYCFAHGKLSDSGRRSTVSNGVAFSGDGSRMYHSDTTSHAIHVMDFDAATGRLGGSSLFREFSRDRGPGYGGRPDGAAVDSENCYWCAMFEGGRLLRFSPAGELLLEISLPVRCPTMLAFGGRDLRTIYVTSARHNRSQAELAAHPLSGHLLSLRAPVAGLAEYAYQQ